MWKDEAVKVGQSTVKNPSRWGSALPGITEPGMRRVAENNGNNQKNIGGEVSVLSSTEHLAARPSADTWQ